MKKLLILIIGLFIFIPSVNGLTLDKLGLTMDIPEGYTVYTREDRSKLENFYRNNIYLEIHDNDNDIIYVRVIDNPGIIDYSNKENLNSEVSQIARNIGAEVFNYVDAYDYRWIKFDYVSKNDKNELIEYYLSWKSIFITITIQAKDGKNLSQSIRTQADDLVKTIKLTGEGKTDGIHIDDKNIDRFEDRYNKLKNYIFEIILCLIAIGITIYLKRKKN